MNIKKIIIPSLAVCIVLTLMPRLFNQITSAQPVSNGEPYDEIDTFLKREMDRLNVPGAALVIVEGNEIVHFRGFGKARPDGETPTAQTPFVIGSLTKSFTALAIMQLVEDGQIELNASVQRYLPWFRIADPQASAQITVRHLLNQTSGLPQLPGMVGLTNFDNHSDEVERQVRDLSTLEISRPVGAEFEYSNLNFNILGLIIEAVSEETYADYIQQHIFDPLDMHHSYTSQAAAREDNLAIGHRYWFGFPRAERDLPLASGSLPSGQLIASAEDMGHYLIAHLNAGRYGDVQVLSAEGVDELHRPAAEASAMGISMGHYAMGWFVEEHGESTILTHPGTVPDFFAFMALVPGQNKGLVLLINANHLIMDKLPFTDMGLGVALQLAGEKAPSTGWYGVVPWALRGLLLIPVLQVVGVAFTLRRIRRWRQDIDRRPSGVRKWVLHILLPLIPNLALVALPLSLLAGGLLRFMLFFMPDFTWISLICGGFAAFWVTLRSWLVFTTLRRPRELQVPMPGCGAAQSTARQG